MSAVSITSRRGYANDNTAYSLFPIPYPLRVGSPDTMTFAGSLLSLTGEIAHRGRKPSLIATDRLSK